MTMNKLQRVQNNIARAVCRCSGRTDARPLLKSLHWLPIHERITYKVAVGLLTYKIRAYSTPSHLSDLLHPVTSSRSSGSVDIRHVNKLNGLVLSSAGALSLSRRQQCGTHYLPNKDSAVPYRLLRNIRSRNCSPALFSLNVTYTLSASVS